jgi:hypothetical protein
LIGYDLMCQSMGNIKAEYSFKKRWNIFVFVELQKLSIAEAQFITLENIGD